jgi:hypothetical protein
MHDYMRIVAITPGIINSIQMRNDTVLLRNVLIKFRECNMLSIENYSGLRVVTLQLIPSQLILANLGSNIFSFFNFDHFGVTSNLSFAV